MSKNRFDHTEADHFKGCGIDNKKFQKKYTDFNNEFQDFQKEQGDKMSVSRAVEFIESKFTNRELAFMNIMDSLRIQEMEHNMNSMVSVFQQMNEPKQALNSGVTEVKTASGIIIKP